MVGGSGRTRRETAGEKVAWLRDGKSINGDSRSRWKHIPKEK